MIDDKELRDLFKIESSEHIQKLNDGLLNLEKDPRDTARLEEVFREAHSLKGAARMVGVLDVEAIAHKFEGVLGAAKVGKSVLTSDEIDRLYKGLDSIEKLVNEAVTGIKAGISVSEALAQLTISDSEFRNTEPLPNSGSLPEGERVVGPGKTKAAVERQTDVEVAKSGTEKFHIETVRVNTGILDMLMTQAGELAVTKTHILRHVSEMEEIEQIAGYGTRNAELLSRLQNLKSKMNEDSARLDFVAGRIEEGVGKIRLVPLSAIFNLYPRMVRDMAVEKGKEAELVIEGGDVTVDKRIIEEMKDPVMHMIRNAIDHGIEEPEERVRLGKHRSGTIHIRAVQADGGIFIEVSDDGKGLDIEGIKKTSVKRKIYGEGELAEMTPSEIESIVFTSGFSTSPFLTELSGRGVGLDVVKKNVEALKGTVYLETSPGSGCRFAVKLPLTLSTVRVLIVEAKGRRYAIPAESVETSRFVSYEDIFPVAGRNTISLDEQPVSVAGLADVLEIQLPSYPLFNKEGKPQDREVIKRGSEGALPCLILSVNKERIGLLVDALVDEQEVVVKSHSAILKHVRNISGATVLATGEICMVLNPQDLLKSVYSKAYSVKPESNHEIPDSKPTSRKTILLAEDSITTRTQEKRILEGAGYEVVTAVDGLDAFNKLSSRPFDAVVSDILMPNIDGLRLTEKIRKEKKYKELPVILVTSLASDEDKKKGMEAGANAYITKPTFDQKVLLEILGRLI